MAAIKSGEERAQPLPNIGGAKPLPNDAELPPGTGHGHSPEIKWPPADNGPGKPFKNLK
jgi:hypothetical protein